MFDVWSVTSLSVLIVHTMVLPQQIQSLLRNSTPSLMYFPRKLTFFPSFYSNFKISIFSVTPHEVEKTAAKNVWRKNRLIFADALPAKKKSSLMLVVI